MTDDRAVLEKIKNQTNIIDLFPELSYEELAKIMDAWMNPEKDEDPAVSDSATTDEAEEASTSKGEAKAESKPEAPKSEPKSPSAEEAKKTTGSKAKDVAAEFDKLFN